MSASILLPIDLSDRRSWERALPRALDLAAGAPLHVIAVIPRLDGSMVSSYFEESFPEKAMHEVGETLAAWVNEHVPSGQEVHPHVTHGRIYDEIIRAADTLGVETIVIGAPPPDPADYLLGPNAARVVRHARQSVYVVRG